MTSGENPYRSDEGVIRLLVDAWAGTSADTNEISIAIQFAVEKEFGLKDAFIGKRDDQTQGLLSTLGKAQMMFEENEKGLRAFVRAQYEETQQYLKDKEIKELILFRGVGKSATDGLTIEQTDRGVNDRELRMMPTSSLPVSSTVAVNFTKEGGGVISSIVPRERIFSTPRSGVGCTNEGEVVVLGGKMKATVINDGNDTGRFSVPVHGKLEELLYEIGKITGKKSLGIARLIKVKKND